jgi:hypothetical protein
VMNRPSFFIIGAPKCGTTSLNEYLDQHPEIAMAPKEVHYFGSDLGIVREAQTEEDYLKLFEGLQVKRLGEASVWTFYSHSASREIKKFNPEAKILLLLRNPWDLIYSLHAQHLYDADENEKDINQALERDLIREENKPTSWSKNFEVRPLLWKSLIFSEHLKRWKQDWGDQLRVYLFQDLAERPDDMYAEICEWLEVDARFVPDFERHNQRKQIRSAGLQALIDRPDPKLKRLVRKVIPSKRIRHEIISKAKEANQSTRAQEQGLSLENQMSLSTILSEEIERVEKLLGRDLSHWS